MLCQQTRTLLSQSEYRTRRSTAPGGIPWFVIPLHQIGAYQRSYHAGVQMRSSTLSTSAEIGQKSQLPCGWFHWSHAFPCCQSFDLKVLVDDIAEASGSATRAFASAVTSADIRARTASRPGPDVGFGASAARRSASRRNNRDVMASNT
jgi:hypothetical protein